MKNANEVKITKRFSAFLIDILVVSFIFSLVSLIRFINPTYDEYLEVSEKYNEVVEKFYNDEINADEMIKENTDNYYKVSKYGVSYSISSAIILFGYFVLFQKFNKGRTIGKQMMKIKVVNTNNNEASIGSYVLRIIPIYYLSIGSIIPLIVNSILLFIIKGNSYLYANALITYTFLIIYIVSMVFIFVRKDKRGLHEIISNTKVINEEV